MTFTEKQKKLILYGIIALLPLSYLYRNVGAWAQRREYLRQMRARQAAIATQNARQQAQKEAQARSTAFQTIDQKKVLGHWLGRAFLPPSRGLCTFEVELKPADDPAVIAGYSTLACAPNAAQLTDGKLDPTRMMAVQAGLNPVSAILSGKTEGKSITFTVDKVIGAEIATANCPPSSLVLTPFATGQIAAEFKDSCGGGQMILQRMNR